MKYSIPYKIIVITMISIFLCTGVSFSAPSGGNVIHGDANINHNGGNTVVNQNSDKAIINWGSFDVANGESVIFNQQNSGSIILNRVIGGEQSFINGSLSANGKVFILNSSGILIGGNASINTGSFLASTGKMSDKDFMNGNYYIHSAFGDITNNGSIVVDNYGYAALLGRKVVNNGVISANLGRVEMASGEAFRVSFYDNNLIGVSIEKGIAESYISNTGEITAEGGTIYMSSKGLSDIIKSTVNNEGVIYAGSIANDGGRIVLSAEFGEVNNNSLIDVSSDIGKAGNIEIYGNDIIIQSEGAVIDASGESGGNIYIKASQNAEVKDKSTITASGNSGNGGEISVLSKGVLFFDKGASLFSQSVTGNGGFIEVSSVENLHLKGTANTLSQYGEHGSFTLDPYNFVITNTNLSNKTSITGILIADINTALTTNGSFTLSAVDISMDPSAYGVQIGTGVGDLFFIASNSINLVSPNINVDKLSMTAEYNIDISNAGVAGQVVGITANTFNLTSSLGNSKSIGVDLNLDELRVSSPEGSTELDSLASATGMKLSGTVGKDLKLTSTADPIDITIDETLSAGDSISFDMQATGSTLVSGFVEIITKILNLDIPDGMANLRDTSFEILTADITDLTITNSNVGISSSDTSDTPSVIIEDLKVKSSFDYTQISLADVIFKNIDFSGTPIPTRVNIELNRGKLVFPFEAAIKYFNVLDIKEASTIIFSSLGSIDLTVGGTTGKTGTDFFSKFGQTTAGSAKLLSFEAVGNIEIDITSRAVNSSLNMESETGSVTASCTSANFCKMASVSAVADGDILFDKFGTISYAAESNNGDITITLDKLPAGTGAGTSLSVVTFSKLITHSETGTITITAPAGILSPNASINILNLNVGSGGLLLGLENTPLVNIISNSTDNLNIGFAGGLNKFGSFSVLSEGSIIFSDAFDFTLMEFLNLTSKFGDIVLANNIIEVGASITLSGKSVTGTSGILDLKTGAGTTFSNEYISLNIFGDNQVEFNILAGNLGILNLGGNLKVNINSATTIGAIAGSSTSMTGNIVVNGNSSGISQNLTLKDTANLDSFMAEGVNDVILDPTFKATTTGEFSINASGKILSYRDATTGDKASIHADHISLIADTIGGYVNGAPVLPTPGNYLDSAIMVEANTGYFEAANVAGNPASIDIGSADFISSLFKYEFFPTPAVDTTAFINGLNINSSWHDDLNNSRNDYYLYNPDLRYGRYLEYDIYDEILALGDDLIISDIVYPKYIHAKFKVGNSIFLK